MEGLIPKTDGYLPYITGPQIPRLTLFSSNGYDAAFLNLYGPNRDTIPDPIMCCSYNTSWYVVSRTPIECSVDWGDGIKEVYNGEKLADGKYILGWRTWNIKYNKTPGSSFIGTRKEDGSIWIPNDNHVFQDGKTSSHRMIFTFNEDSDIYAYHTRLVNYASCPNIELYNLTELTLSYLGVSELPSNRLDKLGNLVSLNLENASSRLQAIPESFFNMKSLSALDISLLINCYDPDASNLRRIGELKNLTYLRMLNNNIGTFIKEFLDVPIGYFEIGGDSPIAFDTEVDMLPNGWNTLQIGTYGTGEYSEPSDPWKSNYTKFKNLGNNITSIICPYANAIPYLPPYIKSLYNLRNLNFNRFISTQERADGFIDYLYSLVTTDSNITMSSTKVDGSRNQFYNLVIYLYGSDHTQWKRPSGEIQAPSGFVLGSSNGNPTSPCEKIYVLTQNYKMSISIGPKPASVYSLSRAIEYNEEISKLGCPLNEDTEFEAYVSHGEILYVDIKDSNVDIITSYNIDDKILFYSYEDGMTKLSQLGYRGLDKIHDFFINRQNSISNLIKDQTSDIN